MAEIEWWRWVGLSVFLHVLLLVRRSLGLPLVHPLRAAVDRVNERGPFIRLVMAYSTEAQAVRTSGEFVPDSDVPSLDLYGRRFHIGTIRDVDVISVKSGQRRVLTRITVQILLDVFDIRGVVHFGIAGSANDSLSFGDVSIPKFVAFTGSWTWTKFNSVKGSSPDLSFGEYNIPSQSKSWLSSVEYKTEELFLVGKGMELVFWLEVDTEWFQVAEKLQVALQKCVNETYCLPETPKVVFGLKGSTDDIFVNNAAYRKFLFKEFGVSTIDEESAAILMTAMSPGVPVIVFRGVSDLAGGEESWSSTDLSDLASINAFRVAVEFIAATGREKSSAYA
ncbi:bark storage protein A-like [Phoenix dactylifera]|uniref:Bark storage protein A-like n=1 Tax=Phoenix dactylifera TaxID=42345 RepID=A0A8B8ZHH8_PHODC|nr:bark storage protein A-like [Phoenix dactylifera]